MMNDPRQVLERLCAERGEDFAGLSRMLGRNAAYIQQFVRRGVPKRLGEDERRKLARYFGVSGDVARRPGRRGCAFAGGLLSVKRHPVTVSAGPGAIVTEELGKPYFAFDERWLKALTPSSPANLSIVRVEGDSMAPTLNAGDDILVDLGDAGDRLRDGIYVLRIDDALVVKRIALNPVGRRLTVQSDNPAYPDWPDCGLNDIEPDRPSDLVGHAGSSSCRGGAVDQPGHDREHCTDAEADQNALQRIADGKAVEKAERG